MKPLIVTTFFATLFAGAALAAPAAVEYGAAPESTASFEAIGKPSLLKIKGHGARVSGRLSLAPPSASGVFEVTLEEFDTGLGLRNRHMKEKYLETAKFPKAVLEIETVELPKDWKPGLDVSAVKFKGQMTLKGEKKPVEGTVKISGEKLATDADFVLSLKEFPVGVPSYMGVTVADSVNVHVSIPAFVRK